MKTSKKYRRHNLIIFSALIFLVQSSRAIGLTVSGTLFLHLFGSSELPYIYMISGILIVFLSQWFFKLSKFISNFKLLVYSSQIIAFTTLISWLLLHLYNANNSHSFELFSIENSKLISSIIFFLAILAEILAFTLTNHLWNFISEYFDIKSGKKYFHYFSIAGTFGAMLSGFGIIFLTRLNVRTEDLILYWFSALILIFPISLLFRYKNKSENNWFPHRGIRSENKGNIFKNLKSTYLTFLDKPYFLYLALFINFGVLLIYSLEFLSKDVFQHIYPKKEDLVAFFATITAAFNAVIILFQFFVFPFLIKRIGVGNSVFIFPLSTLFSSFTMIITSILFPIYLKLFSIIAFFIRSQYKDLFYRLVIDLLVNILDYEEKTRIRLALSGIFKAQSALLSSMLILLAVQLSRYLNESGLIDFQNEYISSGFYGVGFLAIIGAILYFLAANRLRKYYLDTVKDSLKDQSFSTQLKVQSIYDFKNQEDLVHFEYLVKSSPDSILNYILHHLNDLPQHCHNLLIDIYPLRSQAVKLEIIKHIAANPQKEDHPFLVEVVSGDDKEIATRVLAHSSIYSKIYDFQEAYNIVKDENYSVLCRSQALITILEHKIEENKALLKQLMNSLLKSDEFIHKEILIQTASNTRNSQILWDLYPYLYDNKTIEIYLNAIIKLDTESQELFIDKLFELFNKSESRNRHKILSIFSNLSIDNVFPELFNNFKKNTIKEQCHIITLGVNQKHLTLEDLFFVLTSIETSEFLFQTTSHLFYNYRGCLDFDDKHVQIIEILVERLKDLIQSAFLVDQLSETPLLKKVLTEFITKNVKKILTWELVKIVEQKDFIKIANGICSNDNEEIQRAIEFIDIHCSFSKMEAISQYLHFLEDHEQWKDLVQYKNNTGFDRKSILRNLFYKNPYYLIKSVTLYEYSTWFRYSDWPEEEIIQGMPEKYLKDPLYIEALENFKKGKNEMLSTFEKMLILEKVPFFQNLTTEDLRLISNITEEVKFTVNSTIIKAREMGNELYMLYEGEVLVERGTKKVILEPPAHFGEIAILAGSGKRTATVTAKKNCKTLTITSDRFKSLILEFPHIIFPVLQITFQRLALDSQS